MKNFLEQLKWKLYKFMQGRNGSDDLGRTLVYVGLIFYVIDLLFKAPVFGGIGLVIMVYCIFRMLSRNLYARREENRKFVTYMQTARLKFEQRKDYKIFRCKGCGRNIRVPRGKGKIEVTCPMCGKKTIHRT